MKFKYLLIDETGVVTGCNYSYDKMKQLFEAGVIDIIDCENGERLTNWDSKQWESIEDFTKTQEY